MFDGSPEVRRGDGPPAARAGGRSFQLAVALLVLLAGCGSRTPAEPPDDEAMVRARGEGKTAEQAARDWFYPHEIEDYFPGMDVVGQAPSGEEDWPDQLLDAKTREGKGSRPARRVAPLALTEKEVFGRNAWMVWCAGNERFWDWLANNSFGFTDLLKVIDGRSRATRFQDSGLINEPGRTQARTPAKEDLGLWLDPPADPKERDWRRAWVEAAFEKIARHAPTAGGYDAPGAYDVKRPAGVPPPEIYGLSSGVIGLRLFPNPEFDRAAREKWDAAKFYSNASYYSDPALVRPYRVGMSCAFCHASFHPLNPPRDLTDPGWENISGNIGAQYLRIRSVFGSLLGKDSFVYHLLDSYPPGTVDTSLIASDNINNPNTMNAIFGVPARVAVSFENPRETLSDPGASQPSLWSPGELAEGAVPRKFLDAIAELPKSNANPRRVPRILLDGADSIGAWGALARVYLNIGAYSEQWNLLHQPLVGFQPQRPFRIRDCETHSVYWHATQLRVGAMRDYFLRVTPPMRLLDASEAPRPADAAGVVSLDAGAVARAVDTTKLARGRQVFARNCIVCHSSIQFPARHQAMETWAARGEPWDHDPGQWLRNPDYLEWAARAVEEADFWRNNFLSTDYRVAINLVQTNAARAMATNGMTDHMWQDFSSESYRGMPSVGLIPFFDPYAGPAGSESTFEPRHAVKGGAPPGGGGPGFYRVPTLISIWATAPLLHNNSLGLFNNDPSVSGRLAAFDDAIRKLLWPKRRLKSSSYDEATPERLKADHGLIWRTTQETYLTIPAKHVVALATRLPLGPLPVMMGWMQAIPCLTSIRPLWLPSAVLLAVGFVALAASWNVGVRYLGYAALVLALVVGAVVYFANGRLGDIRIGPIPKGTPVDLLANLNPDAPQRDLRKAIKTTVGVLAEIESSHLDRAEAERLMREKVAPALMRVSRCPDFVMDHGHDFPWFAGMTDEDKNALIELLKTF